MLFAGKNRRGGRFSGRMFEWQIAMAVSFVRNYKNKKPRCVNATAEWL